MSITLKLGGLKWVSAAFRVGAGLLAVVDTILYPDHALVEWSAKIWKVTLRKTDQKETKNWTTDYAKLLHKELCSFASRFSSFMLWLCPCQITFLWNLMGHAKISYRTRHLSGPRENVMISSSTNRPISLSLPVTLFMLLLHLFHLRSYRRDRL